MVTPAISPMNSMMPQGNRILIWSENQAADLTSEQLKKTDFDRV
jgi:hypothetical protein